MRSIVGLALILVAMEGVGQTPVTKPNAPGREVVLGKLEEPPKTTTFMFVQTAERGTFTPLDAAASRYRLTLHQVGNETIYFSDRPQRIAGGLEVGKFIKVFSFSPQNPPNAAIVLSTPKSEKEDVIVVELTKPAYDAKQRTLSYDVRVLGTSPTGLAFYAGKRDARLPASFDQVSVFIDDCPDETAMCYGDYQCTGGGENQQCCQVTCGSLGYTIGTCWSWLPPSCNPCMDHSKDCYKPGMPCDGSNPLCVPGACSNVNGC